MENLEAKVLRFMAAPSDEAGFESLALEIHAFQRRRNLVYARYCEHHDGWPSLGAFLHYVDVEN